MSNTYNFLEKTVARLLTRMPFMKDIIKSLYSRAVYMVNKNEYTYRATGLIKSVSCENQVESFFGYYDKSPMSISGMMLCHLSYRSTSEKPDPAVPITVALFEGAEHKLCFTVQTTAYNWQQGARLHWLNDELFIFNDYDQQLKRYIARVFSVKQKHEIKRFDFPIQDSCGNHYFLSLNYRRLVTLCPDYGYRNLPPLAYQALKDNATDGIWRIEYGSGQSRLLYLLDQIIQIERQEGFGNVLHTVNHIMISPSGKRFIFVHRYYKGNRKFDRLILANADGSGLKVLSAFGMVSHYSWINDTTLLGYLRGPGGKDAYWLIDVETIKFTHVADGVLDKYGDGHPHVYGDWFITDTYPDRARMQHLLLCNWKTGEVRHLGEFYHGFVYCGESRCDLHPRFSPCGKKIFFDSVFEGKRRLYIMDLEL